MGRPTLLCEKRKIHAFDFYYPCIQWNTSQALLIKVFLMWTNSPGKISPIQLLYKLRLATYLPTLLDGGHIFMSISCYWPFSSTIDNLRSEIHGGYWDSESCRVLTETGVAVVEKRNLYEEQPIKLRISPLFFMFISGFTTCSYTIQKCSPVDSIDGLY